MHCSAPFTSTATGHSVIIRVLNGTQLFCIEDTDDSISGTVEVE